jgi:hypothetical protein
MSTTGAERTIIAISKINRCFIVFASCPLSLWERTGVRVYSAL